MVSMSDELKERTLLKLILIVRFACAPLDAGHPIILTIGTSLIHRKFEITSSFRRIRRNTSTIQKTKSVMTLTTSMPLID
jgi:hypothetical protein